MNAPIPDDDAAETEDTQRNESKAAGIDEGEGQEPPNKKQKLSGAQRRKLAKEEKKKNRGANKNRRFGKVTQEVELCWKLASGAPCEFGDQ